MFKWDRVVKAMKSSSFDNSATEQHTKCVKKKAHRGA